MKVGQSDGWPAECGCLVSASLLCRSAGGGATDAGDVERLVNLAWDGLNCCAQLLLNAIQVVAVA